MIHRHPQLEAGRHRRGSLTPAIAIAILAVGGCLALVLDSLWLATAHRELQVAAEATALGAASRLANDELLMLDVDMTERANIIRKVASNIGRQNKASGNDVFVSSEPYDDIRLGRVVMDPDTGRREFLETDYSPTATVVKAHCNRAHGNPVSLFFPFLTGQSHANVVAMAEASVNNEITGVRPLEQGNVPAIPLGILDVSLDPRQLDSWTTMIEQRQGSDNFRWDEASGQVVNGADGLPELTLKPTIEDENPGNLALLNIGNDLVYDHLKRQFRSGWSPADLVAFGGEFNLTRSALRLEASNNFQGTPTECLKKLVGHARIIVLFQGALTESRTAVQQVLATRLAAARIMHVAGDGDHVEITIQPSVIATRTAVINTAVQAIPRNQYIYKLSLTH